MELSLNDLVYGIMLGDNDYITNIEDETKRAGIYEYHFALEDVFNKVPELLFLLVSYTKQTPTFSDLPKDRVVKDAVFLSEPLEKVYSKFLGDKKRGRIEYTGTTMYDRLAENIDSSENAAESAAGLWINHTVWRQHREIVELKKLILPYFFKLYEKPFLSGYGSWAKVALVFSKDKRLTEFLEKYPDTQCEVEFKTDPKLLEPN